MMQFLDRTLMEQHIDKLILQMKDLQSSIDEERVFPMERVWARHCRLTRIFRSVPCPTASRWRYWA